MKKISVFVILSCVAAVVCAAPRTQARASKTNVQQRRGEVRIEQFPRTGRASTLPCPQIQGASIIGNNVYNKASTRKWIVLESKYSTFDRWTDQLTFTWHVMLDSKFATEKAMDDKKAQYSYYTTSVTYANIPKGSHAACVCLPPACLERFGEPKAIGIVISNKNGEMIAGDVVSEIKGIQNHPKSIDQAFWNDKNVMEKVDAAGERLVEQRQGLLDRSKTIWALVNPNDYEQVVQ